MVINSRERIFMVFICEVLLIKLFMYLCIILLVVGIKLLKINCLSLLCMVVKVGKVDKMVKNIMMKGISDNRVM